MKRIAFVAIAVWLLLWARCAYADLPRYNISRYGSTIRTEAGFVLVPLMLFAQNRQDMADRGGQGKSGAPNDDAWDFKNCHGMDPYASENPLNPKYMFITKAKANGKMFYYAQHLRGSNLTVMIGMRDLDSDVMQVPDQLYTGSHSALLGDELREEEVKQYAGVLMDGLHAHLLHFRKSVVSQCKNTLRQLESGSQSISQVNNTFIDVIPSLIYLESEIERQQ